MSGRYPPTAFHSPENHIAYCARHGYAYIHCNWPTRRRTAYMNKMEYVRAYYQLFDFLFWIDDDAFFIDLDQPLEPFLPRDGSFLSICRGPEGQRVRTVISSGQFALRCNETGQAFVDVVREVDLAEVAAWWSPELGFFTRGDQDCIVYVTKTDPRFADVDLHDAPRFNSRIGDLLAGDPVFLLHLTGRAKARDCARAQRRLGRGPSLLPPEEAARWTLVSKWRRFLRRLPRPHRWIRPIRSWLARPND